MYVDLKQGEILLTTVFLKSYIEDVFVSYVTSFSSTVLEGLPPQVKFASAAPLPHKIFLHKHSSTNSRAVFIQTINTSIFT